MSVDEEDLRKQLEKQIELIKNFPTGPSYKSMRKNLAKMCFEAGDEEEGILNLIESHAVSLRTRAHSRWICSKYSESGSVGGLNGTHVQHGDGNECNGMTRLMERLSEMPPEWSLVQLTYAHCDPASRFSATVEPSKRLNSSGLHISRFECGKHAVQEPPFCITVPITQKHRTLQAELHAVIEDYQSHLKWNLLSSQQYYKLKGMLEIRMKNVTAKLESDWLGHWASLFVGRYVEPELEDKVTTFVDHLLDGKYDPSPRVRRSLYRLAKASAFLPEWEMRKGVAECLGIPIKETKDIVQQLLKVSDVVKLRTSRRHPIILLLDEDLELFPWEMLSILQDHPVSRLPSLYILYALFKEHEHVISRGKVYIDAKLGYYIVNPEKNLPRTEKRLRPFLKQRTSSWKGTFGIPPTSEEFKDILQSYDVFVYSGHGSGSQFLQGEEIEKLKVRAVTFLFGCSSATSKILGGRVEPVGMWHFYLMAGCPLVIGNLWSVSDTDSDIITMHVLHKWLPQTREMLTNEASEPWHCSNWKQEPELLYTIRRSQNSQKHYLALAALVARGLPVALKS